MKIQIPIYRAKKIDSDEYVEGFLSLEVNNNTELIHVILEILDTDSEINPYYPRYTDIDPSTLAIHFPNMTDSEGTKIFASLNPAGIGGDIVTSCNTCTGLTAIYRYGHFQFVSFPLREDGNATHAETYTQYIENKRFDANPNKRYSIAYRNPIVVGINK